MVLAESRLYIELSAKNPLSRLPALEISDLKNTPCILVINRSGQQEEQEYYETVIGLKGEYLFADTMQEARHKAVTGQGYMPVDVIREQTWYDTTVCRMPDSSYPKRKRCQKNLLRLLEKRQHGCIYYGFCGHAAYMLYLTHPVSWLFYRLFCRSLLQVFLQILLQVSDCAFVENQLY